MPSWNRRARAAPAVLATSGAAPTVAASADHAATEPFRPAHPAKSFMDDPNGLIRHDGRHHLFYQHNPFGSTAGNGS